MDKNFFEKLYNISLNHTVLFNPDCDMNKIETYIRAIGQANEFYPNKVLSMVQKIDKIIPLAYYNENNPNNGSRLWTMEIGRESSAVIYIHIKTRQLNKDRIDPQKIPAIISDCMDAAKKAKADEISYETDKSEDNYYETITIRFWWD
jgi:hypothetical protein